MNKLDWGLHLTSIPPSTGNCFWSILNSLSKYPRSKLRCPTYHLWLLVETLRTTPWKRFWRDMKYVSEFATEPQQADILVITIPNPVRWQPYPTLFHSGSVFLCWMPKYRLPTSQWFVAPSSANGSGRHDPNFWSHIKLRRVVSGARIIAILLYRS